MKRLVGIALALVATALGWWLVSSGNRHRTAEEAHEVYVPPTTTLTDSTEIFQKAFWKRPGANDKILHAERREWADADGVKKWQWFIAVEPSPELVKYLREDNAFGLTAAPAPQAVAHAPEWFTFDPKDMDVLQAPRGGLCLLFSKTQGRLYATDLGGGFKPGAPEPTKAPPTTQAVSTGRLPPTPPPNPP